MEPIVDSTLAAVVGWIGNCLSWFFFLSPLPLFIEMTKTNSHEKIPGLMLLFNTLNTGFWVVYGFAGAGNIVWICNGIGLIFSTVYVFWYLAYRFEKLTIKALSIFIAFIIIGHFIAVGLIAYLSVNKDFANSVKGPYGTVALIVNVFMYIGPGQNIVIFLILS